MDDNREAEVRRTAEPTVWAAADARGWIAVPTADDDKYSRGVLGMVTGSARYPGAAVLGAEAAARTGVGMVRYLGAPHPTEEVLRRPGSSVRGCRRTTAATTTPADWMPPSTTAYRS